MAYRINEAECVACGACQPDCPVSCISEKADGKRVIDEATCVNCGLCASVCPVGCIAEV